MATTAIKTKTAMISTIVTIITLTVIIDKKPLIAIIAMTAITVTKAIEKEW